MESEQKELRRNKERPSGRGGKMYDKRKPKEARERRKAKTRLQGGIKKRGRQKGKESGGERGQGGAVQTGTKLQTQCVVIHCSPQLLCTHMFVRVGQWMGVCACACACQHA